MPSFIKISLKLCVWEEIEWGDSQTRAGDYKGSWLYIRTLKIRAYRSKCYNVKIKRTNETFACLYCDQTDN